MIRCSILAILKDGEHVCMTQYCKTNNDFHGFVRSAMLDHRYNVLKFYYAYGCDSQQYTPSEFREVFCPEPKGSSS